MFNFIIGVVVGITVATVGFTGIFQLMDTGVSRVQETVKEVAR
jgi:hypothetical protein